jgi:uroporphyrinogen-III decarboxylase
MDAEIALDFGEGDFAISDKPLSSWIPGIVRNYESRLLRHEALNDDAVPYASLWTGTEIFAAAFGCAVHMYPDSPARALPLVRTADEADKLHIPKLTARPLDRVFEAARQVLDRLGPDVPIGVPDIQSPFDIAALIWNKEDMFAAMYESPDSVHRLVEKCCRFLTDFITVFKQEFPNCNLCHCPYAWAPPESGCWLSEDEVGSLSAAMFREFCLPNLAELSATFGGLYMHCCADADHQYAGFAEIPNFRGLNRVFQASGPRPAVEKFTNGTVLVLSWMDEQTVNRILDMAVPGSRFLFNMPVQPVDDAKRTYEHLRERCPRSLSAYRY